MTDRRARLRFQRRLEQGLSHAGLLKVELASALGVRDATVSTWFQATGPDPDDLRRAGFASGQEPGR